ncbi:MAG: M20/M25/M40 family metallo-hydrolase [Candidatus Aminicenantes bacterium]|nr:M20/M25/M40 family metallo-hydrolase [Candidatus Aminicenantes bacterium]NIM80565.1 M20/M25/M40 family metallo-hydrolase [Candidatus Aminicenantes bacterium]NIN19946.1 M20/M25/M40 family metallo-hydrolase [Candidatus Aminicenantes bacterium]NIN43794.1 M20/M25/M40 family metallo-hydrolase [Candidatus Aminicenantes bacterium]NIN86572.1 M20/M25/M40 family metallo-hydrolase [Candidatus Aminicenantes bacterium]
MNMNMNQKKMIISLLCGIIILCFPLYSQEQTNEEKLLEAMHSISSHSLFDYVKELCSEKYGGRLTGTAGYDAAAQWVASLLKKWEIQPAGDNRTYFQFFPNPYTRVLESGELVLHIPLKKNVFMEKHYQYETEFFPGSTSDSGEVKAEVVYVGYGTTAPELNYDDYKGLDVKGKIVLMEREVPVSPSKEPEVFKKWRPYSFHQYKVKNVNAHGAAGMLYNYHIVNPNCLFIKDFILTYVGKTVVNDIFLGTGKTHQEVVEKIKKKRKPQSFKTKKIVSIQNATEHHPEGKGCNVIGYIEGSDPELKKEVIMIGGHLDHLGCNHKMMPGANDNASGVAVMLGIAEAIHKSGLKPRRSIIFNFFGAEEQGVKGSEYYLQHPFVPNKNIIGFINMDSVGRGTKLRALAGENYPELWKYIDDANKKYIHREVTPTHFHNLARPRLDAARFMWAGVPTISFSARGAKPLPYATYHTTKDNPDIITPEIMEDLAQLLFVAVLKMAEY